MPTSPQAASAHDSASPGSAEVAALARRVHSPTVQAPQATPSLKGQSGVEPADGGPTLLWQPRLGSSHLAKGPGGVWYLRLTVPERIRKAHPALPKELKRSTKTAEKRLALARAREMCIEFSTRYITENPQMLAPSDIEKQAFSIVYADGAIRMESSPMATPETLFLMQRVMQRVMLQICGRAVRATESEQSPPNSILQGIFASAQSQHDTYFDRSQAFVQTTTPPTTATPPAPRVPTTTQVADGVSWLSDAIDVWLKDGGVTFSQPSWDYSYSPSFRTFRELIGTERRDLHARDGTVKANQLDIPVRSIDRTHIRSLHERLRQLPARQGQRDDGVEAMERIRQGLKAKHPPPSLNSVSKKLGHIKPFLFFAKRRGWITQEVVDELDLAVQAATGAEVKLQTLTQRKAGAVALSDTELKRLFEQKDFAMGASSASYKYWTPLLYLYNGLRVSESSGLYTNDIFEIEGVLCLSVVNDLITGENGEFDSEALTIDRFQPGVEMSEEEFRRVKNTASRRVIPVHPRLIELGFLQLTSERKRAGEKPARLFPDLRWEQKSMYGRQPSEYIRKLLKSAGVHQPRRKVAHSLRSNFSQRLATTGLADELQSRVLGHSTGTMKDRSYGETDDGPSLPLQIVYDAIGKVRFDIKLQTWAEVSAGHKRPCR